MGIAVGTAVGEHHKDHHHAAHGHDDCQKQILAAEPGSFSLGICHVHILPNGAGALPPFLGCASRLVLFLTAGYDSAPKVMGPDHVQGRRTNR